MLAATAAYAVGDRALLGMLGARPFALAEDPLLRSTADRHRGAAPDRGAEAPADRRHVPPGVRRGARAGWRDSCGQLRSSHSAAPRPRSQPWSRTSWHMSATRDVLPQTYAVLLSTTLLEISRVGGFLARFLLAVLAPIGAAFTHLLLSSKRELRADAVAAGIVDPHDLADALIRLDRAAELVEFHASPATEPLYTVSPFDEDRARDANVRHASAARRARVATPCPRPKTFPVTRRVAAGGRLCRPGGQRRPAVRANARRRGLVGEPWVPPPKNRRHPTLPGACAPSTIGASGLDFSVRNGKRYFPVAMTAEMSRGAPCRASSRTGIDAVTARDPQNSIAT